MNTKNDKRIANIVVLGLMSLMAIVQIFNLSEARYIVFIGIIFFFVNNAIRKTPIDESGFSYRLIGKNFKIKGIFIWLVLPAIVELVVDSFGELLVPGFIAHTVGRVAPMLDVSKLPLMFIQLIVLALGEEIAWRAFFQNELCNYVKVAPAILLTSAMFAIWHIAPGDFWVVAFDISNVFIMSVIYGIIFYKTKNAWMSFFAHLFSNIVGVIVLFFIK